MICVNYEFSVHAPFPVDNLLKENVNLFEAEHLMGENYDF